jgi:hypothetical protein
MVLRSGARVLQLRIQGFVVSLKDLGCLHEASAIVADKKGFLKCTDCGENDFSSHFPLAMSRANSARKIDQLPDEPGKALDQSDGEDPDSGSEPAGNAERIPLFSIEPLPPKKQKRIIGRAPAAYILVSIILFFQLWLLTSWRQKPPCMPACLETQALAPGRGMKPQFRAPTRVTTWVRVEPPKKARMLRPAKAPSNEAWG